MNFNYTIVRKPYRRNATIKISEDNRISVIVPRGIPDSRVEEIIRQKSVWIQSHLRALKKYESGEVFPFLGENLTLEAHYESNEPVQVKDGRLIVGVPFPEAGFDHSKLISSRLVQFGRRCALEVLTERVAFFEKVMKIKSSEVHIKNVRSVWGSCNLKGRLTFNWRIVMAPVEVIDYVVVHELSHIAHHNHSDRFWAHIERFIPDYKVRREWLRSNERTLKW